MCRFLLFFFCFCSLTLAGQKVQFLEISLDNAMKLAKSQNKKIFVDTYASYCKPCKKMELEFRNPKLASYFNANFINVRVNMEGKYGPEISKEYQIVFLPTLLFLTDKGKQTLKLENLVSANELLALAKSVNRDVNPAPPVSEPISSTTVVPAHRKTSIPKKTSLNKPKPQKTSTQTIKPAATKKKVVKNQPIEPEGKILKIVDSDNLPPELLREEAYYRMTKMDGSHVLAAKKYLETQSDSLSEINIRFIHDFLHSSRSNEFDFLIQHKKVFEETIGPEIIEQSINILVNKELERAYPKPDLDRALVLYSYTNNYESAHIKAHNYLLQRLYEENDFDAFLKLGDTYFNPDFQHQNSELLYRYSSIKVTQELRRKGIKRCLQLAELSTQLASTNYIYQYNVGNIALQLKDKNKALLAANKAMELCKEDHNKIKVQELLDKITEL